MRFRLAVLMTLLGLAPAAAQPPFEGLAAPGAAPKPPDALTIKLTLHPAAAPVPALKYRLLPELRKTTPGNAVFLYYRAFAPEWSSMFRRPEVSKLTEVWTEDPRKVPPEGLRPLANSFAVKEIDRGARRAYVDWELTPRLRESGIALLIPDVQGFREYGNLLAMRARLQIADGKFDDAAYTLETGMKFGRDIGNDGPILVQSLVGIAITTQTLVQVEEFIQAPKSPNLYWALTDLPKPFISLRRAYEGERIWLDSLFPGMREMIADRKSRPMSEAEVHELIGKLGYMLEDLRLTPEHYDWRGRLALALLAAQEYPQARRFLLSQGRSARDVDAIPVLQAVLMFEVFSYDRLYDDFARWVSLPYRLARPGMDAAEQRLKQAKATSEPGTTLATLLLPAVARVTQAQVRTDRRIAALRVVEAIRLHAAGDGKLPARLDDIKEVPVPPDPMTGRAFDYHLEGNRAVLYGPPPGREPANESNALRYELTLER